MPSDEHVALLRKGTGAWNAWRDERDEAPDLSQAGLRGLDLSGFNLSCADLQGADLRGTNLSQANWCQFGGGKPFQSIARRRRSRRGDAVWSPIPELCTVGRRPKLAIGVPRRSACLWRGYSRRKPGLTPLIRMTNPCLTSIVSSKIAAPRCVKTQATRPPARCWRGPIRTPLQCSRRSANRRVLASRRSSNRTR